MAEISATWSNGTLTVSTTDTEGMNLEEITETYINQMMGEYYNSVTGLNFQYPSDLVFNED